MECRNLAHIKVISPVIDRAAVICSLIWLTEDGTLCSVVWSPKTHTLLIKHATWQIQPEGTNSTTYLTSMLEKSQGYRIQKDQNVAVDWRWLRERSDWVQCGILDWVLKQEKTLTENTRAVLGRGHVWLCDPTACSPPGSSAHGGSPGENTAVGCHSLLQGIFPTQGSNPGLLHCRWILCRLSHQGIPRILEWVAYL